MDHLRTLPYATAVIVVLTGTGVLNVVKSTVYHSHNTSHVPVPAAVVLDVSADDDALAAALREQIVARLVGRGAAIVDDPSATRVRVTLTAAEMHWASITASANIAAVVDTDGREARVTHQSELAGLVSRPHFRAQTVARVANDIVEGVGVAR